MIPVTKTKYSYAQIQTNNMLINFIEIWIV